MKKALSVCAIGILFGIAAGAQGQPVAAASEEYLLMGDATRGAGSTQVGVDLLLDAEAPPDRDIEIPSAGPSCP
jgi:hypothetical protein